MADLPVNDRLLDSLKESTGVKAVTPRFSVPPPRRTNPRRCRSSPATTAHQLVHGLSQQPGFSRHDRTGETGSTRGATICHDLRRRRALEPAHARAVTARQLAGANLGQLFLILLAVVAILFLIIQGVALLMGLALARSITSSIHELFMGTDGFGRETSRTASTSRRTTSSASSPTRSTR